MADIKLFRPQRLTDNPDGGGLATATEVVDGEVNNLFDDISRIDRVNGELSLRKAFVIADTDDTELYSDVHLTVAAPPLDPRVSAVLFRTGVWDDQRDAAKAAVERYLDESVISRMIPYDRQLQGQRTVLVYQRPELALPEIGEVFALKNETAGTVEFIRVQDVKHGVETFTDANGDYQVRVITLTITQPLSREFAGSQPNRFFTVDPTKSVVRKTIASDAARYKGVVVLAQDAHVGDLSVKVESIFAQLVPAATSEVPVVDAVTDGKSLLVPAASTDISVPLFLGNAAVPRYVPTPVMPGSFGFSTVFNRASDDGRGHIAGALNTGSGTINYVSGAFIVGTVNQEQLAVQYRPAAAVGSAGASYAIPVQIQNRGYVYTASLHPAPTPGATTVHFRAQGRWYTLEDDGSGALVGDAGVGSGLVNFQTGSVQATLGALPDIGSAVIITWGGSSEYEIRTGDVAIAPPAVRFTLAAGNCEAGTLALSWPAGGATKTATVNAAGVISGDATGRVVHATGEVLLKPALLPDPTGVVTCAYRAGATEQETFTPSLAAGAVTLQASVPPRPGSVIIEYTGTVAGLLANYTRSRRLTDNGSGQLVDEAGVVVAGSSVNYTTGAITFAPNFNSYVPQPSYAGFANPIPGRIVSTANGRYETGIPSGENGKWIQGIESLLKLVPFINGTPVQLRYKPDSASDDSITGEQHAIPALVADLTPGTRNPVVPGGLLFNLGTRTYYERGGTLYYGMSPATGAGTAAGSLDYVTGEATLTKWEGGIAPAFSVQALLTQVAPLPLAVVHGRTPGSPLRPGTFYLQANRYRDGALITALADNNGNLHTSAMHGSVDVTNGVFSVAFGAYVLDSSLTSEDKAQGWYDPSNVDANGYIWRPDEVMPGTVRFNCVVQSTLPLDPGIIKVNPVRLPLDGRVPVLRAGDTLVISDPQAYPLPSGLTAGQVVTLPRGNLNSVALYDANGLGVAPALYTVDKAAGKVAMADPLDLAPYAQPLVAIHTVEDMAACLDAQITGQVALGAPLSHAYAAGQALVSSALILGDAQARYEHLFAQNTWTSAWDNARIGSTPTGGAQYNDALYPVVVKNRHAVTQRWRLNFTSATAYQVVGETMGVIATGTTSADCAPINPATGQPYFTLKAAGFGAGWATGNQLRFNTVAAGGPVWVARTVLSGPASQQDDRIRLDVRWDKD